MNLKSLLFLITTIFAVSVFAQNPQFEGKSIEAKDNSLFLSQFYRYDLYQIPLDEIVDYTKGAGTSVDFNLQLDDDHNWDFRLAPNTLVGNNYRVSVQTDMGVVENPKSEIITMQGGLADDQHALVALTTAEDFLYGFVKKGNKQIFIEPAWYFDKTLPKDIFVIYTNDDVKPTNGTCGAMELEHNKAIMQQKVEDHEHDHKHDHDQTENVLACFDLELAIANDAAMFDEYGSIAGVEAHNLAVNNNVITDYDMDFFNNEIIFVIVETFIVTNGNNPWPEGNQTNPDAGDYLDDFTNWGNSGGFSVPFDLATLWTGLDLAGSTIGIAWLSAVCTNIRYNVCQDFSTNADLLRVLVSHEYGHNFSSQHDDGGGFIMSPSVNNTTTWSTQSANSINNFTDGLISSGCLSPCAPPVPPTAIFSFSESPICEGSFVTFVDQSVDNPTSWSWSMPGATPSTSTEQNPIVQYNAAGTYTVTLTVSNSSGSNSTTNVINVGTGTDVFHFETFENGFGQWTVENQDGADTWESISVPSSRFGNSTVYVNNFNYNAQGSRDGLISPTLDFVGRTFINLEIDYAYARFNANFRDSLVVYVSTDDGANFTRVFADTENGGGNFATAPQTGQNFEPDSPSEWCFGTTFGTGCLNIDLTPFAGSSMARIKIENVNGWGNNMYVDNVKLSSDCQSVLPPVAEFFSSNPEGCVPFTVNFTDASLNSPTSWAWSFPGGNPAFSTDQNPTVNYSNAGTYEVSLTVSNGIGSDTRIESQYIIANDAPAADFFTSVNGLTVQFINNSFQGENFVWDFGDGNTSNLESPAHTYDVGGIYPVSLTVTNDCGTDVIVLDVEILLPPVADFTADNQTGCTPFTVTFTDQSTNNPSGWSWSFPGGDPSTSTDQNPIVTYDDSGSYDVTLTVTNAVGSDEVTKTNFIIIDEDPVADFAATVNGAVVTIQNNSTNATSYFWDFGDGIGTSSEFEPTYVYNEDGIYNIKLETTNDCGTDVFSLDIEITTAPTIADFTADATLGCVPATIQFTDQSPGSITSWSWTFEGGNPATSSQQNPTVTYNTPGTFDVTLVVSNDEGSASNTETDYITIEELPIAGFTSSVNGQAVDFTNTSTNADTFEWDFGDGQGTSTEVNPSYDYGQDGTFVVTLTATNVCGEATTTETVVTATLPTGGFIADVTSGCAPLTVQFTSTSSPNATSFNWTFEGGNPATSTDENPVVTYDSEGIFDVALVVTNSTGSDEAVQSDIIVVVDVPVVDFSSLTNDQTIDFTNLTTNANSFEWDFGDGSGTSIMENPTYTYAEDGFYQVTLTATNDCGSASVTQTVVVSTLPQADFTSDVTSGCAPLTVQYTSQASGNTQSWSWTFEGGNPATSTNENPVVFYDTPGTYTTTLTVSNSEGDDTFIATDLIVVNGLPTADFDFIIDNGFVNFTNTSTNATSFSWDFGDDSPTSTEASPEHIYTDGTYTAILTAFNDCGSVEISATFDIVTLPIAGFSADVTTICVGETVQFTDESSDNVDSWFWQFEGGTPATSADQNPTVTYNTPGIYSVEMEITNDAGSTGLAQTGYITVLGLPTASFGTTIDGNEVTFTSSVSNATTISWDFGDSMGTSTENNPVYVYQEDGLYTTTLSATNDCGTVEITQLVSIATQAPIAAFEGTPTTICPGESVQFANLSSENADSFIWSFEGGTPATSTDENPVVTYSEPGVYDITLVATNALGSDEFTLEDYIEVVTPVTADFDVAIDGTTITLTNNSTNANSFEWNFGNNDFSAQENPVYTYAQVGTYDVTLTAFGPCGPVSTTQEITVNLLPPTAFFSSDVQEGCSPLEVHFFDESENNPTSYLWSFPGGMPSTSTDQNPIIIYETAGVYDVTLATGNAAGSTDFTAIDFIDVADTPIASYSYSADLGTVTFDNQSQFGDSFQWSFGDGATSTVANPTHTYDENGTYLVTLVVTNDCGTATFATEIDVIISSTRDIEGVKNFSVFPNPNNGVFTIALETELTTDLEIEMWTIVGQQLYREEVSLRGNLIHEINVSDLPKGVYILGLNANDQSIYRRIVIE